MRVGILTFHSQLNYGGVLQCWALQTALRQMGHDVVVIDRWQDKANSALECGYNQWKFMPWIKFSLRSIFGLGAFDLWKRHRRTKKFLREHLHLTPFHFVEWKDAPEDLGVDLIVVGSDQVWHCGDWGDPRAYLLDGTEGRRMPPAIAYAASFGMKTVPPDIIPLYKRGLARFKAISCREAEGTEICQGLGFAAKHVVDPTLLLKREDWLSLVAADATASHRRKLVCYFLSVNIAASLPPLAAFAAKMDCDVEVLVNSYLKPFPKSVGMLLNNLRSYKRVKVNSDAGPKEFVRAFSSATWTLTDSFHAVMFSSQFDCNLRFIRPTSAMRATMFARIEEFANKYIAGNVFVDDVSSALESFEKGEDIVFDKVRINATQSESLTWLRNLTENI